MRTNIKFLIMKTLSIISVAFIIIAVCIYGFSSTLSNALKPEKPYITFGNPKWESVELNNSIAAYIVHTGFGYRTKVQEGSSSDIKKQLRANTIDVLMEYWIDSSIEDINQIIKTKQMNILSVIFSDAAQGFYVPTCLIKGDPSKGIKALAPNLKSVNDLNKYWSVFKPTSTSKKGSLVGGVTSWDSTKITNKKFLGYKLNKNFNFSSVQSETMLNNSIIDAIEDHKPWLGYYWTPTWIMGKYNLTLLTEAPYNKTTWEKSNLCAFPGIQVSIVCSNSMLSKAPDVVTFLKKYKTDSAMLNTALAYKHDKNLDFDNTAKWFLREHQDLVYNWLPESIANKVIDELLTELK